MESDTLTTNARPSVKPNESPTQPLPVEAKEIREGSLVKKVIIKLPAKFEEVEVTTPEQLLRVLRVKSDHLTDTSKAKPESKEQELLRCNQCEYTSHNKHYLKQHVDLVHLAERPFKCPFCDYAGKRSHALKEHLVVHSSYRPFECHFCNASFRKKGHLTNHIKLHASLSQTPNQPPRCSSCHTDFAKVSDLWSHLRSEHQAHLCEHCPFASLSSEELQMHSQSHTQCDRLHRCTACGFSCSRELQMMEHIAEAHEGSASCTVHREVLLKCSECGFTTPDEAALRQHMLTHLTEEERQQYLDAAPQNVLLKCSECGETAANQASMKLHLLQHVEGVDTEQPTEFNCAQCNFSSREAFTFITHMLTHRATTKAGSTSRFQLPREAPPSSPQPLGYVHDATTGVYRCTICSYTCEHQRTIKAHTWKHSGHKDIDYPRFQNGPLSIFDYTPVTATEATVEQSSASEQLSRAPASEVQQKVIASAKAINDGNAKQVILVPAHVLISDSTNEVLVSETQATVEPPLSDEEDTSVREEGEEEDGGQENVDALEVASEMVIEEQLPVEEFDAGVGVCVEVSTSQDSASEASLVEEEVDSEVKDEEGDISEEQAIRLLSLLKNDGLEGADRAQLLDHSYRGRKKMRRSGISDSLLAAIEHLREASESDESPTKVEGGKGRRGRKRKVTEEDEEGQVERLEDKQLRCCRCHYTTASKALMESHLRVHRSKRPMDCSLCSFSASDSAELQAHVMQHCKARTYACRRCPAEFSYKSQLRAHARAHEEGLRCEACGHASPDLTSYQRHLATCQRRLSRLCQPDESKHQLDEEEEEEEQESKEEGDKLKCPQCEFIAESEESYRKHVRWHGRTYRCEHCDFACTSHKGLAQHMRSSHFADGEQKCRFCDFVAGSVRSLKSHMKRHANDQRFVQQPLEQYLCNLCGYVCHHLPSLKAHMWRHASDANYSYSHTNQAINAAIDGDTSGPPADPSGCFSVSFSCCQCGFESPDKAALNAHMKVHQDIIQRTLAVNMGRLAWKPPPLQQQP